MKNIGLSLLTLAFMWAAFAAGHATGVRRAADLRDLLRARNEQLATRDQQLKQAEATNRELIEQLEPPPPPPPGSENDPAYQADIIELPDGSKGLLPAPAFRNQGDQ